MVGGTAAITLLLVGAIGAVDPGRRAAAAAAVRNGGAADRGEATWTRRVPAGGTDTISWLAREFNTMADSVTGLVGEVRHQRERLETVINSIDDGIVVLDAERRVIAANDAFLVRARQSRDQVLGCQCRELTSGGCTVAGLSDAELPGDWRAAGADCASGARRKERSRLGGGARLADPRFRGQAAARRGSVARHLGAAGGGGASGGVAPAGVAGYAGVGVLARIEHAARDGADVRGGHPARDVGDHGGQAWIRDSASIAREQILRCRGITQHFLRHVARAAGGRAKWSISGPVIAAVARLIEPTARAHSVRWRFAPVAPGRCTCARTKRSCSTR